MTRTTPPRLVDVAAVLPQLAPMAQKATRLHPRAGTPSVRDSSVGGPLLWPADQPWPRCDDPHVDRRRRPKPAVSPTAVRLQRQAKAAVQNSDRSSSLTAEGQEILKRTYPDRPWPDGPVAMLPVAQLYARDVPALDPPGQADLLQVLWCPFAHSPEGCPRTSLFWRKVADITDIRTDSPETVAQSWRYVPELCEVHPEPVTEYPSIMELSEDLQELLKEPRTWEAAGVNPNTFHGATPREFYWDNLSVIPGWKVRGWPLLGLGSPIPRPACPACSAKMAPLLTIDSTEWGSDKNSWIPYEDQQYAATASAFLELSPTRICIGDLNTLQLYSCPVSADHPHTALVQ